MCITLFMSTKIQTFLTKYGNISCYLNDIVFASHLRSGNIYEEDLILNYIIPCLNSDSSEKVILDIGSHIGTHSIVYSKLVNCKIHAFEPQRKIYEILKKNIESNHFTNCTVYNYAVGHKETITTLSNMLYDGYDCQIEYDIEKTLNYGGIGLGKNGEEVKMVTVDSLGLTQCDYIKIDVEGAEMLVLMGAEETLKKYRPIIWFEKTDKIVSNEMKESLGIDFEIQDIFEYLSQFGYRFYNLNDGNVLAIHIMNQRKITIDISKKEQTIYSESGEDGILFELFTKFGMTDKFYVEFGAENGTQCNTRALKEYGGFNGILFDMHFENPQINLYKQMITSENVISVFKQYNVPSTFDLLSVDIDSHDFYVLHEILKYYTPRIFVCEYNGTHLPNEDKVVLKNTTNFNGNYFGASILSFYKLANKYNYSLVYANEKGVNLFFIHNDVLKSSLFTVKNMNQVENIYKPPKYGNGPNGGHPPDIYNQSYISADIILE